MYNCIYILHKFLFSYPNNSGERSFLSGISFADAVRGPNETTGDAVAGPRLENEATLGRVRRNRINARRPRRFL